MSKSSIVTEWLKNWMETASAALETASTAMEDLAPCLPCNLHPVPTEICFCSGQMEDDDDNNDAYWNDAWCRAEGCNATPSTTNLQYCHDNDGEERQ
jgi:hypothetical protein